MPVSSHVSSTKASRIAFFPNLLSVNLKFGIELHEEMSWSAHISLASMPREFRLQQTNVKTDYNQSILSHALSSISSKSVNLRPR